MTVDSGKVDALVVIATKGRPKHVALLLRSLSRQAIKPRHVCVVGTEAGDVEGLQPNDDAPHPSTNDSSSPDDHEAATRGFPVSVLVSDEPGLCVQRNRGLAHLLGERRRRDLKSPFFVVFFDDDFRPSGDWIAACCRVFERGASIVGLTGRVLADGIHGPGLSEEEADAYLDGRLSPTRHWASGDRPRNVGCLYGCNMAFRDVVVESCRFDERLSLYGWQEDQDFSSRARRYGRLVYEPSCRGVHLGTKSGRTSGLRLGYSQIANPWYLSRKGTIAPSKSLRFIARHLASNTVRSLVPSPRVDYAGRLRGNLRAIVDLATGRCAPERILNL